MDQPMRCLTLAMLRSQTHHSGCSPADQAYPLDLRLILESNDRASEPLAVFSAVSRTSSAATCLSWHRLLFGSRHGL
jgi:hypothetical protein